MGKYLLAGLYYVPLLLLLCTSGCFEAGGGFIHYGPPRSVACGKPWVISVGYSVVPVDPKERYGKLTERFKEVTIHIRDSSDSNFIAVPMVVESVNPKIGELQMKADMKPIPCDSGIEYVEYYIADIFGPNYNRTTLYRVPVSKN